MAKKRKEKKPKKRTPISAYYKVEGDHIVRTHRTCPKCGEGYFLAEHKDRWTCGHCGYTEFKEKKQ